MTSIDLFTTGRRTGKERRVRLYALIQEDDLVVVGSGGAGRKKPRDPDWVLNLRAEPRARVTRGKREYAVKAREARGAHRKRLRAAACGAFPYYEKFQARTEKPFGIFVLRPVSD